MSVRHARKVIAALLLLAAFTVAAFVFIGPRLSYRRATMADTPSAYREFLRKHVRSPLADHARKKLADALWRCADYDAFVEEYPDDARAPEARQRAAEAREKQLRIARDTVQRELSGYQELKTERIQALSAAEAELFQTWALLGGRRGHDIPAVLALLRMAPEAIRRGDFDEANILMHIANERMKIASALGKLVDPEDPSSVWCRSRSKHKVLRNPPVVLSESAGLKRVRVLDQELRTEGITLQSLLRSRNTAVRRAALEAVGEIIDHARTSWRHQWEFSFLREAYIPETVEKMTTDDPDEEVRTAATSLSPILEIDAKIHMK